MRNDITLHHHQPCALYLNQTLIPEHYWHQVKPKPHVQLLLLATVKGFRFKSALSLLAPMALSILAPWARGLVNGAQWLKSAASVGTMAGGSPLLHKLLPSPHPNALIQYSLSSSHRLSPTYDITGGSNRARPYQPVPLVLGKHKLIPDLAATPFTLHDNNQAYYHVLLNCGLGRLKLSNIKIGTVPIEQCNNVQHQIIPPGDNNTLWQSHYKSVPGGELISQEEACVRSTPNVTTQLRVEIQYQLYTVHRHNGHTAPTSCQLQLQYRKLRHTPSDSQSNHDMDENQDGIDNADSRVEADSTTHTDNTTVNAQNTHPSKAFPWQLFPIKRHPKQPQVIPQANGLFTLRDANLQANVLVLTLDVLCQRAAIKYASNA